MKHEVVKDIAQVHDIMFEDLCVIDDICREENVRWFLDSGTEIGAAREGDFIQWDDDMDIKVLAEDYPAFKAAMEKHLPPYMKLVEPDYFAPGFYDFIIRIYDKRYFLRTASEEEQYYKDMQNHVGMDVFIFTKVPDSAFAKRWLVLSTKILYGLGMAHRYAIHDERYTFLQKAQVAVLSTLGRLIPAKTVCNLWRQNAERYRDKEAAFRFCSNYSLKALQVFPEALYRETAYLPVRGRKFPVPAGYDSELRQQYGDYMVPVRDPNRFRAHMG